MKNTTCIFSLSAKAKTFVPRKKNILVISKPDGTRVNNIAPEKATAQPPEPPATTESAAKSVAVPEPATKDAGPTKPEVKAVKPTPEVKAVEPTPQVKAVEPTPAVQNNKAANPTPEPVAATASVEPAGDKQPVANGDVQPIKPASLNIDDEPPSAQPATEKTR